MYLNNPPADVLSPFLPIPVLSGPNELTHDSKRGSVEPAGARQATIVVSGYHFMAIKYIKFGTVHEPGIWIHDFDTIEEDRWGIEKKSAVTVWLTQVGTRTRTCWSISQSSLTVFPQRGDRLCCHLHALHCSNFSYAWNKSLGKVPASMTEHQMKSKALKGVNPEGKSAVKLATDSPCLFWNPLSHSRTCVTLDWRSKIYGNDMIGIEIPFWSRIFPTGREPKGASKIRSRSTDLTSRQRFLGEIGAKNVGTLPLEVADRHARVQKPKVRNAAVLGVEDDKMVIS